MSFKQQIKNIFTINLNQTKDSSSRVPGMMSSLLTNPHNGSKIQAAHIKHSMHGISHALPGEELEFDPPPPVHYGMNQVKRSFYSSTFQGLKVSIQNVRFCKVDLWF